MSIPKRQLPAAALAAALLLAAAASAGLSVSPLVSKASAYVMSNGCDEYDPDRGNYYECVPDRTTFYTPDGINPNWVYQGTEYGSAAYGDDFGGMNVGDTPTIPPPAPFSSSKDYCSNPWYAWSAFEGIWQRACYNHDVCYGSQLGRKYCDVRFWKDMIGACKAHYSWYDPARYPCFADAVTWYGAVREFGAPHYVPRKSSFEP